jgi:hypothetical protein
MRIQAGVLVPLGYGKYVRSDRVTTVSPIDEDRGPGRRTFVYVEGQENPLIASRAEDTIVRDLLNEPREVTRVRQQQEVLRDLLDDLSTVNDTLRQIVRDQSKLDLRVIERRIKDAIEDNGE